MVRSPNEQSLQWAFARSSLAPTSSLQRANWSLKLNIPKDTQNYKWFKNKYEAFVDENRPYSLNFKQNMWIYKNKTKMRHLYMKICHILWILSKKCEFTKKNIILVTGHKCASDNCTCKVQYTEYCTNNHSQLQCGVIMLHNLFVK